MITHKKLVLNGRAVETEKKEKNNIGGTAKSRSTATTAL
jgi:hypothetical protein